MESIKPNPKEAGRMHFIFMVQRNIAVYDGLNIWQNVKAFTQEKDAETYVKSCKALSHINVMRVEKEILVI